MSEGTSDDEVEVTTSLTPDELEQVRGAFHEGSLEGVTSEHEGMTRTLLFEVPDGHLGISIGSIPGHSDMHITVSEWEQEPHHELDEQVWVRSRNDDPTVPNKGRSDFPDTATTMIDRGENDEMALFYDIAGQLLGTVWLIDGVPREVLRAKQHSISSEVGTVYQPKIVLSGGATQTVNQFLSGVRKGDIEATDDLTSQKLARSIRKHLGDWRRGDSDE